MHSYNETLTLLLDFNCEIIVLIFLLRADRFLILPDTEACGKEAVGVNGKKQGKKNSITVKLSVTSLLLSEGLTKPHLKCTE